MMLSPMLLYSIFCILIDLFYNKQQIGKHLNRLFLFRNVGQGQFFIHSTSYIIKLGVICPLYCPSRVQSVNSNSWALRHRPSIQSYQSSKRPQPAPGQLHESTFTQHLLRFSDLFLQVELPKMAREGALWIGGVEQYMDEEFLMQSLRASGEDNIVSIKVRSF